MSNNFFNSNSEVLSNLHICIIYLFFKGGIMGIMAYDTVTYDQALPVLPYHSTTITVKSTPTNSVSPSYLCNVSLCQTLSKCLLLYFFSPSVKPSSLTHTAGSQVGPRCGEPCATVRAPSSTCW